MRLHQYHHDVKAKRADTLRRQLNQDLAKALAYQKSGKTSMASQWAERLVRAMVKARLLSNAGVGDYRDEVGRSLREDR